MLPSGTGGIVDKNKVMEFSNAFDQAGKNKKSELNDFFIDVKMQQYVNRQYKFYCY